MRHVVSPTAAAPRLLGIALAVAFVSARPALALDPDVPLAQVAFNTWDYREGLPTSTITTIARTNDGTIWLGSELGLIALDGVNVRRYTINNTPELPTDAIESLVTAGDVLWIGTSRGLVRYDDGKFTPIGPELGLPEASIELTFASTTGLWVGTRIGVFIERDGRFVPLADADGKPAKYVCSSMDQKSDGTMVLACGDMCTARGTQLVACRPIDGHPHQVAVAPDDSVWISVNDRGIYREVGGRPELVMPRVELAHALMFDSHGALWIAGVATSLQRRSPDGLVETLALPRDLGPAGTTALLEEPDGSMLIGTSNIGLLRLRSGAFRTFDRRSDGPETALAVFADRAETIWMSGEDLSELRGFGRTGQVRIASELPALSHTQTSDGRHYVGGPGGVSERVGDQLVPTPFEVEGTVLALASTKSHLWIGTSTNLYAARGTATTRIEGPRVGTDGPLALHGLSLLVSNSGTTLWVGTDLDLCRIDGVDQGLGAPPVCLSGQPNMPVGMVLTLHEDRDGTLWAGTYSHGLLRIRDGRITVLTQRQGLFHDSHYAILEDAQERFWMSGPTGIVRVERAALDGLAEGRVNKVQARLFGTIDGLPVDETTGGGTCATQSRDGRMWFSTPRGVVMTNANAPDRVPMSPSTVIEQLEVDGETLSRTGGRVPPGERDLLVRYTAPTLERAADVKFRYRLDGVDRDWIDAGTRRVAMYTGLAPGSYDFTVEALAFGAKAYGPPARFTLELEAGFRETLAFKIVIAVALALLLYAGHRFRLSRLVARERQLEGLVNARTSELAVAQGELVAINASLAERVDSAVAELRQAERMAAYGHTVAGVAHEVRQPLFALGTTAFVLGDKLRDRPDVKADLQLLERETRRMNRVMEELLDFAKPRGLLLGPCNVVELVRDAIDVFRAEHDPETKVPISVTADDGLVDVRVDASRIQQVLVNLMSNAQKHAAGMTELSITCGRRDDRVVIDVSDDGVGIPESDRARVFDPFFTTGGTGLGLAIASRIIQEHGGTISIATATHARGTTFRISLPIRGPDVSSLGPASTWGPG